MRGSEASESLSSAAAAAATTADQQGNESEPNQHATMHSTSTLVHQGTLGILLFLQFLRVRARVRLPADVRAEPRRVAVTIRDISNSLAKHQQMHVFAESSHQL